MLLGNFPFSLISFNDDTDPKPGVRNGRVAVVLGGGFDTPRDGFEMDGDLLAASVIEARGRTADFTVSSGDETIEALDGGFAIPGACGFETDDEMVGLDATDEDNRFLSAEGWAFVGMMEALRVWVGMGGFADCIAVLVVVDGAFFTGEAVGEGLTPAAVTLDRAGFVAPVPTTWRPDGTGAGTVRWVTKRRAAANGCNA